MGCRLIRGETIYFVRQAGPICPTDEPEWQLDDSIDNSLLPRTYSRSDGRSGPSSSVIPIEIKIFKVS
ncbi:MAG: hypothetical protein ACTHMT_03860 [Verrucomicrobiota bacterium]|jgi:hypothetical protein